MINPQHLTTLLFDLDGTLLDSFSIHLKAFKITFAHFDIHPTEEELLAVYSPDWFQVYRAFGLTADQWALADKYWLATAAKEAPELFPGTLAALQHLQKKYRLGLITSGSKERVWRDLRHVDLVDLFEVIITGGDVIKPKPNPEGLNKALQLLGVSSDEVVYVGDTAVDRATAQAANMPFIGIINPLLVKDKTYEQIESICELDKFIAS